MRQQLLKRVLIRVYLFDFVRGLHFFAGVLVPFFTDWGGLSLTQVQLLQSWFMLWIFLFEVPTGVIADRFGRKTSLMVSTLAITLATQLYGHIPNLALFLLGEMAFAFGYACASGAKDALVYDFLHVTKAAHLMPTVAARSQAWHLVGIMSAAPIGSWLASRWGMNVPMLLAGLPMALSVILAWSLPETRRWRTDQQHTRAILGKAWAFIRAEPNFLRATLDLALVSIAGYYVIWLYQPLLLAVNVPMSQFGWYHVVLTLAQIGLYRSYSRLSTWLPTRQSYLRLAALLTVIGYATVIVSQTAIAVGVFLILAGGFGLTRRRIGEAYLNDALPPGQRATLLSGVSMANQFCLIILNPIIGYLADHSLTLALISVATFPILALCLSMTTRSTLTKPI